MNRTRGQGLPRVEAVSVRNFRCLRDVQIKGLMPVTAFLGANGSGKSTLLDVFAFLAECFRDGLRMAWERRGRFKEMRTWGAQGPIVIEIKYRERPESPGIIYHLAVDENENGPFVAEEWIRWRRWLRSNPFRMLDGKNGMVRITLGEMPDEHDPTAEMMLGTTDVPAVAILGQMNGYPRISALRRYIAAWRFAGEAVYRSGPAPVRQQLLDGIRLLQNEQPERLREIFKVLEERIPGATGLLTVAPDPAAWLLSRTDLSQGTLSLLAHLIGLADMAQPALAGMDLPETGIHPRLQPGLAGDFRTLSAQTQCLISTHSPFLANGLTPEEVWAFNRNKEGHTIVRKTIDLPGVRDFMSQGAMLGYLWTEGYFEAQE
ncbi:MAG TPA: AAA family ATPase [Patescibacteria group bacterium]|nr:AAA family ATPase [Patescibacteria group bacterium]